MINKNNKVVLGLIGAGGRGTRIIMEIQRCSPGVEVKYVCDVDNERGGRAITELERQQGFRPIHVTDMRHVFDDMDVDAVLICTPEQWHALATIRACQAGKDVLVEKNISLSIHESRQMIHAANKYKRIIQCGTQNRSAQYAINARRYIQSGKLGKIVLVKTYCMLSGTRAWNLKEDSEIPKELDWDLWLGPAPKVPYNISRHRAWYDWWEYSSGQAFGGDASHVLDLARMVLGDPGHPVSVFCAGGRVLFEDDRPIPDNQTILYDFGAFPLSCESSMYGNYMAKSPAEVRFGDKFPDWRTNSTRIEIYGTEGLMYLGRHGGGWQVIGNDSQVIAEEYGYHPDEEHQKNFIHCIRTRETPNGDIKQGHLSATLIHMGNISYRLGNKQLFFDSSREIFTNDPNADDLGKLYYRQGYELPVI